MFILVETDGYSIHHQTYSTQKQAQEEMQDRFNSYCTDNVEGFSEMSYCGESEAILYARGENVYVWKIISAESIVKKEVRKIAEHISCKNRVMYPEPPSWFKKGYDDGVKDTLNDFLSQTNQWHE